MPKHIIEATAISENLSSVRTAALRPARAGLSNRDFAQANLMFWGTSMTEGGPGVGTGVGPAQRWRRWSDRLQAALRDRLPLNAPVTGSTGYIPAFFQTFYAAGTSEYSRVTPLGVTYSGNLTGYGSGLGARSLGLVSGADWIQFTFTGDAFDLFVSTHTTASPTVMLKIDGVDEGSARTLPATTLTSTRFRVTGLAPGSHTVRATWASVGPVVVDGLMPYNGDRDKGIHVWDAGRGSAKISDVGTSSSFRGFQQMGLIQPSLVGVEWGYNEYFGNIGAATFKTNLTAFVAACAANVTVPPTFLFIIWPLPAHPGTPSEPYANYVTAIKEVAAATANSVVVDFSARIAPYTDNSLGLFYPDWVHWSDKGSAFVADVLAEAIINR
jgi:hypothetical protein